MSGRRFIAPEGWKKTKVGVIYRFEQKRGARNSFLSVPKLTLNNELFTIWYPAVSEGRIDEYNTQKKVGAELKKLLGIDKYISVAKNDYTHRGKQLYHVEYYTKLRNYPSKDQIKKIEEILDSPIIEDE